MAPWTVVARSFRPAPRIPGIASDAPPPPRSRDTHSREDLGSPAPAHRAPGAGGDHIRGTQTPCEQACAAPTVSASSPLRPVRADTPGTPATTESQSILCASTAECTQKSHLTESSIFEGFPEFLRRAALARRGSHAGRVSEDRHRPASVCHRRRSRGDRSHAGADRTRRADRLDPESESTPYGTRTELDYEACLLAAQQPCDSGLP